MILKYCNLLHLGIQQALQHHLISLQGKSNQYIGLDMLTEIQNRHGRYNHA